MKLCQKCLDAIKEHAEEMGWDIWPYEPLPAVPEFECEFWAHHKLNDFIELEYGNGYLGHSHKAEVK